jgi:hypothetical protein
VAEFDVTFEAGALTAMIPLLFMTTVSPKLIKELTPEAPPVEALSLAISDHAPDESSATNALP